DWQAKPLAAISDFYFDQCLAYAKTDLDDADYQLFYQAWAAKSDKIVLPKLLVVLDSAPENQMAGLAAASEGADKLSPEERLQRELLRLATRKGIGPVLYAGRGDPQVQWDEITAAIAAMEKG